MSDRPRIILAVGLPGSGKSTYLAGIGANAISTDAIRRQLTDDETDQTINSRVFATVRYLLTQRVELRRPETYIDATNLTRKDRKPFIRFARERNCAIEALLFDTPVSVCKARNAARGRVVPKYVMDQMAAKFVPPSRQEGFDKVAIAS